MTRKTKIIKGILSLLWWLLAIALLLLLINVLGAKFRGEVPRVFGYSIMQIVSGSMEDTIETGTYILVKETAPEDIKEGDIISFYSEDPLIYGMPNTHRVTEIKESASGREYVTRGDANAANDRINAKESRLIGVYVMSLDALGDFSNFLSGGGMFLILGIIWAATFAMIGYSIYRRKLAEGSEDNEK